MGTEVIVVMVVFMVAQAVRAIYASLKKERVMVREGGSPLPTSVWVFLGIEVLIAPLVVWLMALLLSPIVALLPTNMVWLSIIVAIIYAIAVMVSRFVSVTVAWVVKIIMVRKYKKEIKDKQEQEVANYLREQVLNKE